MVDLDNIFKYASPKYVYIRNAKLGIMKYLLMVAIFFYVIVYEIIYSCTHLSPHHASGFGSIGLESPKNPRRLDSDDKGEMSELKYCQHSKTVKEPVRELAKSAPARQASMEAAPGKKPPLVHYADGKCGTFCAAVASDTGWDEVCRQTGAACAACAECSIPGAPPPATGAPTTTAAPCVDDPKWIDSQYGDGTSHCNSGPVGGIVAHPKWCSDHGDYSVEARRACPKACGLCTAMPNRQLENDRLGEESIRELKDEDDENADPAIGDFITKPDKCRYFDGKRVLWSPPQPSELFIPTRYEQIMQEISEDCYDPAIHGVKGSQGGRSKFKCTQPWVTKSHQHYYTAGIEDFDLYLQHTFQQPALGLSGTSVDYQGFLAACKTNHPAALSECKRMKIPNSVGDAAPEDLVGLTSAEEEHIKSLSGTDIGDRIRLGDLLKMTPVAQKNNITDREILDVQLPEYFAHPGKSLREVGGMLLLDVNYDNFGLMRPGLTIAGFPSSFEIKPITYTYRPYFVPMKQNVKIQLLQDGNFPNRRTIDKWYGVTIRMQFNGVLVKYSSEKVMTALTNGLVLLSMATTLVMYIAAYLLPLAEKYNLLMYQMSEDFSNYRDLRNTNVAAGKKDVSSMTASGNLLLNSVKEGNLKTPLTNDEKLNILCVNEMRLNRLDGMDPKMAYLEDSAAEAQDLRRRRILDFEDKYYADMGVKRSVEGYHSVGQGG